MMVDLEFSVGSGRAPIETFERSVDWAALPRVGGHVQIFVERRMHLPVVSVIFGADGRARVTLADSTCANRYDVINILRGEAVWRATSS